MQISITGRHVDITDAMRDYASSRVEAAVQEFPRVESVHMILDVQKYIHKAEVVVQASNHIRVDAKEETDNMYASIDGAIDKAHRQLRKLRDKVQHHKSKEKLGEMEIEAEAALEREESEQ